MGMGGAQAPGFCSAPGPPCRSGDATGLLAGGGGHVSADASPGELALAGRSIAASARAIPQRVPGLPGGGGLSRAGAAGLPRAGIIVRWICPLEIAARDAAADKPRIYGLDVATG
jgi:hypothetical protein